MNGYQPKRFPKVRALVGVVAILLLLQASVSVFSAPPPPSWAPPTIYKNSAKTDVKLGEQVIFNVTITNRQSPDDPLVPVTWYNVTVTDVFSSSLTIDEVSVGGTYDGYTTVDQTVIVTATSLAPGEWFVASIKTTVKAWPGPSGIITNTALVEFEDDAGNPGVPALSNPAVITVEEPVRVFLPIILRHQSP